MRKAFSKGTIDIVWSTLTAVIASFCLVICAMPRMDVSAEIALSVPVKEYMDVATVDDSIQNGCNYIDITVPDDGQTHPVVIWIHGGSWYAGSRKETAMDNTKRYLLNQGYAYVSADYILSEIGADADGNMAIVGKTMQMVFDIKTAVRYLRAHAAEYDLNTDFICCMGGSAGATLALLMGTTNGNSAYEDLSMGNAEYSSDVQAVASYYGPTYFSTDDVASDNEQSLSYLLLGEWMTVYPYDAARMAEAMSPVLQLSETSVPMYFTHAADDTIVSISQAVMMSDAATNILGAENVATRYYESGGHAGTIFDSDDAAKAVGDFIDAHCEETLLLNTDSDAAADTQADDAGTGDAASQDTQTQDAQGQSGQADAAADVATGNPFMNVYAILLILLLAVGDGLLIYIAKKK